MWIDIDDLRAEIRNLERQDRKGLRGEMNVHLRASYTGILVGYKKVEQILDEMEENYQEKEEEYSRNLMEEQQ
nr:MAG TPA: hypothetical protein [Caudoviricetes sp.]